jgi:hypothetical protein
VAPTGGEMRARLASRSSQNLCYWYRSNMGDLVSLAGRLLEGAGGPARLPKVDLSEGDRLVDLFFADGAPGGPWCHRRVVMLRFLAERRGQWTVSVDFTLDKRFRKVPSLLERNEGLVPLLTFSKDVMPAAHVRTRDEKGDVFALASTRKSRLIECMMLITLAHRADVLCDVHGFLADLTDTDPRLAEPAFQEVERCVESKWASLGAQATHGVEALVKFACAARLFRRSIILLAPFPKVPRGETVHKIVSVTFDAPIRLTKYAPEFAGYAPLRVAPQTIFGGDASSYHVQFEPPDGVVVVHTRMLFAYTAQDPRTGARVFDLEDLPDDYLCDHKRRTAVANGLSRLGLRPPLENEPEVVTRPLPKDLVRAQWHRWWGTVLGSAEPLSAHVRVSARRLPGLIQGRDVIAMFQLYPDMSAFAGLLIGAGVNFLFLLALYLAVHGDLSLIPKTWKDHPEPLFIVGALIAGFGSGLALYRRDHIITEQVARPWRLLFGLQVGAVLVALAALLTSVGQSKATASACTAISWLFYVAAAGIVYLALISLRAWVAQRAGGRVLYGWQGFVARRRWFKRHWYTDEHGVRGRSWGPLSKFGVRRAKGIIRHTAEHYLNESYRRTLFNQGIPAASRHDPGSRGSTRA